MLSSLSLLPPLLSFTPVAEVLFIPNCNNSLTVSIPEQRITKEPVIVGIICHLVVVAFLLVLVAATATDVVVVDDNNADGNSIHPELVEQLLKLDNNRFCSLFNIDNE